MVLRPAGVIIVNNDLTDNIQAKLVTQLHITEVIDGSTFDARIAADEDYVSNIKLLDTRVLVKRSLAETTNRASADVVIFVSHGLAAVLENKFGPPNVTYPIVNITWGKLCIF